MSLGVNGLRHFDLIEVTCAWDGTMVINTDRNTGHMTGLTSGEIAWALALVRRDVISLSSSLDTLSAKVFTVDASSQINPWKSPFN